MGAVSVWDRRTGTQICQLPERATTDHRPAFSLDGKSILLHPDSDERWFGWFDAASGQPLRKFEAQDYGVTVWHSVFLSADKRTIIARSLTAADGMLRNFNTLFFWDAATGRHLGKVQVGPVLNYRHLLAFSPDGKSIAVPGQRNIYLLDIASRSVVATLQGHENEITCMAFSPDGRFLLTGSQDKTAVLWDVATGKIVHVLKGHPDAVLGLAFSPTGTHMATQSTDHIIRIWPVDLLPLFQKRLQRNFFPNERQRYELPETQSTR
jgi:WD40 repeat protein